MVHPENEIVDKNVRQFQSSKDIFVGIDLGTSQSAIATSTEKLFNVSSVVGYPKDLVSFRLLRKPIVFGDECYRNRMSLDLYHPLEKGVISLQRNHKNYTQQKEAINGFIHHLISLAGKSEKQRIYAIVGAPSKASKEDKQAIVKSLKNLVDAVLVVSEPFLVFYGMGMYGFGLVIDIGAGILDICRMHGSIPEEADERTLYKSGNHIDKMFYELLKARIPNAQISPYNLKQIKEQHGFVGKKSHNVTTDLLVSGKAVNYDITNELQESCRSIISDMCKNVRDLITNFDLEYQDSLRENIMLAGCGSKLQGLESELENELSDIGKIKVRRVEDPIFAGAIGGLKFARDMPIDEWEGMKE